VLDVIENDQAREEHEDGIRRVDIPFSKGGNARFNQPDQVVADIAHRARAQGRKTLLSGRLVALRQFPQHLEHVALALGLRAALIQFNARAPSLHRQERVAADVGVAAYALAAFDAFQ
jgi:hypothetical protein